MTHISMKYGFFLALAGVILCGGCQSDPVPSGSEGSVTKLTLSAGLPEAEATKTALGAEDSVSWRYFPDTIVAVRELKANGWKVYAVEQTTHSITPETFSPEGKTAVVFGHEVFGVQQEVIDLSDGTIEIPQYGTKHSLNVSVAAGIILYELSKRLHRD